MLLIGACATTTTERHNLPPLETVPHVDLSRYVGTWYEIASFDHRFQKGCTGTNATYSLRDDGEIAVVNRCRRGSLEAKESETEGRARVTDQKTNAKLEVTFFYPFWGEYWIIDLDPEYQHAAVGHPSRDYLWILSRSPHMETEVYDAIVARLKKNSYQVSRLRKTLQTDR